jgi:hypothetical protein
VAVSVLWEEDQCRSLLVNDRVLVEALSCGPVGIGGIGSVGGPMRSWRPTAAAAWVLVACIVLGGVLAVCVVFGPAWLAGPQSGLTAAGRLSAENAARATLLQGLVGLLALGGVAVGAVVTFDQVKASREARSIDLFNKAARRALSRTSRSLGVMRYVSWRASGRSRTVPASPERQGARPGGVRASVQGRPEPP